MTDSACRCLWCGYFLTVGKDRGGDEGVVVVIVVLMVAVVVV